MKLEVTTARDFGSLIRTARQRAGHTAALGLALRVARSLGIRIGASLPEAE
jgi:hypothetical protein